MSTLPAIRNEEQLHDALTRPYDEDVELARRLDGDVIVLGAGGKMGPTLVVRIARALEQAGSPHKVIAASRFSHEDSRREIEAAGAETISVDLMADGALDTLPDCTNVIYLVGMKFGASGRQPLTWALNAFLPGKVASRFRNVRIVALSTGNVYPMVPVETGGCAENVPPDPVGEYAQSCLGRERIFEYFSQQNGTPVCLIRLNYAVEARYGVFLDIAEKVRAGVPVSLDIGYVNTVWQGDANSVCFRALEHAASPAAVLNLTGREVLSVRDIAQAFAERFGVGPVFQGIEGRTALLSDASKCHDLFGRPRVPAEDVIDLVARWLEEGGSTHGKPTQFEVQDGRF